MPATIELSLDTSVLPTVHPGRLHGAACRLFGHPEKNGHPWFSAWPLQHHGDRAWWRLGWLPDIPCPPHPVDVLFGETRHRVTVATVTSVGFAELAAGPPARRADLEIVSPLFFSRNGRDLPGPDPELMLRSPLERWNRHAPPPVQVPDDVRRTLMGSVYLVAFEGGTAREAVGERMWQTGFVGAVTLGLTRAADTSAATAFAALMRYAETTGIGAQTAHGFGAVRTRLHGAGTAQHGKGGNRVGPRERVFAGEDRNRRPGKDGSNHCSGFGGVVLADADDGAAQRAAGRGRVASDSPTQRA